MKINRKASILIELSVFIICSMILLFAVTKVIDSHHIVVKQMMENNNIMFIMDSIESKIKYDLNSGKNFDEIDFEQFGKMLYGTPYHLIFRNSEEKIDILLGVYISKDNLSYNNKLSKVYKKEVFYK